MCQLTQLQFACGHTRKVLHESCMSANRLSGRVLTRAPDFCFNGLHVVRTESRADDCQIPRRGYKCREYQYVRMMEKLYDDFEVALVGYDKRVEAVNTLVKNGVRPRLDKARAAREKVHEEDMRRVQEGWDGLPDEISWYKTLVTQIKDSLKEECAKCLASYTAKLGGMDLTKVDDKPSFLEVFEDHQWEIEYDFYAGQGGLHDELIHIEDMAIYACLDGVGWTLPTDDPEGREELEKTMYWRSMKPMRE